MRTVFFVFFLQLFVSHTQSNNVVILLFKTNNNSIDMDTNVRDNL